MAIASDFQLKKYTIPKLFVEVSPNYEQDDSDSAGYFANYTTTYSDDSWIGEVAFGFRKTSANNPSNLLFEIIIIGQFTQSGENNEETEMDFIKLLKSSGAATLIPITRAAMVSTCALTGHPGICVIPNINVFQMKWNVPPRDGAGNKDIN